MVCTLYEGMVVWKNGEKTGSAISEASGQPEYINASPRAADSKWLLPAFGKWRSEVGSSRVSCLCLYCMQLAVRHAVTMQDLSEAKWHKRAAIVGTVAGILLSTPSHHSFSSMSKNSCPTTRFTRINQILRAICLTEKKKQKTRRGFDVGRRWKVKFSHPRVDTQSDGVPLPSPASTSDCSGTGSSCLSSRASSF